MASTGGLVASPVTVLSAIAFQSVITVGSSAAIASLAAVACRWQGGEWES
ncbi:MAG: hypothetical protein ACJ742_11290 [Actinomycetes bacterium]|jgi:hypothetical protein